MPIWFYHEHVYTIVFIIRVKRHPRISIGYVSFRCMDVSNHAANVQALDSDGMSYTEQVR